MADNAHAAAAHAQGHSSSKKTYLIVFGILFVLTAVEVLLGYSHHLLSKVSLVLLALIKAGFVGYYFMHLGHERKALKLTVVIPFAFPALYAFVLIAEAIWRFAKW